MQVFSVYKPTKSTTSKMKKLFILTLLITVSFSFGKPLNNNLSKLGLVSGKVIDKVTKEPLPYVNIVVKDTSNKIITGDITNEKGQFVVKKIPKGKSVVEIQFIGYKTVTKKINIDTKNRKINLGTISLEEDSTALDEVEIRAETSTVVQKVDRKVINVGKDLTSAGTTASELLNNVQSVSVDSQTGNISLRGNENVRVLVDGKPTNISASELLKQIPSTSIKSVELITNPSAKYNPEGMSGIINIILNKNTNIGFNGSINTGVTAGHYVRYNASTNMNYKTGDVNFYGNYGYRAGKSNNYGFANRTLQNINQNFTFRGNNKSHLIKVGADWYINDKNTFSVYTTQNFSDNKLEGKSIISSSNNLITDGRNYQNNNGHSASYNINYKHDFKKGHNIELEANFGTNKKPENSRNQDLKNLTDTSLNYINKITTDRKSTLINLDYTNPISKNGKLELGLEYRVNSTNNSNQSTQLNNPNSAFDYQRNIYSGYINYGHKFGKLTTQLGARFEQYKIEGNFKQVGKQNAKVTDAIFSVYPSAYITYSVTDKDQFQVSYSRRVDRPSIGQINPIREWSTPLITSLGNPNLSPQFTNSLEFNYSRRFKGGRLSIGSFYRNINDVISRVAYKDPNDSSNTKQILSRTNFDNTNAYGFEFSAGYKIAKWWRANFSSEVFSQKQFGVVELNNPNAQRLEIENTSFSGRLVNSFTVSKKLRLQLFSMYRSAKEDIQWKIKPMWMVNAGASYSVLKGKGSISFRYNDIFKGMKFGFTAETPYKQVGQFNWESHSAYIGFNYRFGSGKNRAKSRRKRDKDKNQGGGFF